MSGNTGFKKVYILKQIIQVMTLKQQQENRKMKRNKKNTKKQGKQEACRSPVNFHSKLITGIPSGAN